VHVAVTGIEKVLPTLEDLATAMRLLPRSATGQATSNYFSMLTGPRGKDDVDGPEHMYVVLVDAGRTGLIGGEFQEMLRCIRCGACMNHCPVYQKVGGHAYGWVYPGPMGSVLTPSYVGLDKALDLPQAATLCGECNSVCPVGIPLSDLLRKLREKQTERHLRPWRERAALAVWGWFALHPTAYGLLTKLGVRVLERLGGQARLIRKLPLAHGWTEGRDMPAPVGRTFRELYAAQRTHLDATRRQTNAG
jgi:L-lactate dehydrogenase complex protein LldF